MPELPEMLFFFLFLQTFLETGGPYTILGIFVDAIGRERENAHFYSLPNNNMHAFRMNHLQTRMVRGGGKKDGSGKHALWPPGAIVPQLRSSSSAEAFISSGLQFRGIQHHPRYLQLDFGAAWFQVDAGVAASSMGIRTKIEHVLLHNHVS
jgi:hypothetical protein